MSAPQICNAYARPLVSGLLLLDSQKETTHLQESFQNLIGIASQAIINRQHQNSDTSRPLQSDPAAVLKAVGERLRTVASGRYQVASSEEKRTCIKFDGWLPPESPTDSFESKWIKPGLFEWANGKLRSLLPSELDDLPSTTHDFPFNQCNLSISVKVTLPASVTPGQMCAGRLADDTPFRFRAPLNATPFQIVTIEITLDKEPEETAVSLHHLTAVGVDEVTRITRATHSFGILGEVAVRLPPSDTRIEQKYQRVMERLH